MNQLAHFRVAVDLVVSTQKTTKAGRYKELEQAFKEEFAIVNFVANELSCVAALTYNQLLHELPYGKDFAITLNEFGDIAQHPFEPKPLLKEDYTEDLQKVIEYNIGESIKFTDIPTHITRETIDDYLRGEIV